MAAMDAIMELARHNQIKVSLVPMPPPIFVLWFAFSILHGNRRHSENGEAPDVAFDVISLPGRPRFSLCLPLPCIILNANRRTKNRGRPWNEARLRLN